MDALKFASEFLRGIGGEEPLRHLFDFAPEVAFFVKDRQSRHVMVNRRTLEGSGATSEEQIIGKAGRELLSADRLAMYLDQDRQVLQTGQPILNGLCPSPEKGSCSMIVFSKVPLRDRRGRVVGLCGFYRDVDQIAAPSENLRGVARALEMIHQHYAEPLSVRELAVEAGLSWSQLDRQFRRHCGAAPAEYLARVRVYSACRLLREADLKATVIALRTGFYDHSHFCRTFRRVMGTCPNAYRHRHVPE